MPGIVNNNNSNSHEPRARPIAVICICRNIWNLKLTRKKSKLQDNMSACFKRLTTRRSRCIKKFHICCKRSYFSSLLSLSIFFLLCYIGITRLKTVNKYYDIFHQPRSLVLPLISDHFLRGIEEIFMQKKWSLSLSSTTYSPILFQYTSYFSLSLFRIPSSPIISSDIHAISVYEQHVIFFHSLFSVPKITEAYYNAPRCMSV